MSKTILNYSVPEMLYVNTRGNVPFDTSNFPLGYAIPHENITTKAYLSKKETVDTWAGNLKKDGFIVNNEFVEGFKIEKSVSRYSTSNKWFNVRDPRGFTLQISADNLVEIIHEGKIDRGTLVGKYVWGRSNSNVWLMPESHDFFHQTLDKNVQVGDLITGKNFEESIYMGKKYHLYVTHKKLYLQNDGTWTSQYGYYTNKLTSKSVFTLFIDEKPIEYAFKRTFYQNGLTYQNKNYIDTHILMRKIKDYKIVGKSNDFIDLTNVKLNASPVASSGRENGYCVFTMMFDTKEEMKAAALKINKDNLMQDFNEKDYFAADLLLGTTEFKVAQK